MPDTATLSTIASIVTAAGVTMLFFRVQREAAMAASGEATWIAVADWLLIGATLAAIVLVLLPILLFDSDFVGRRVPTAACSAALVAVGGYVLALPAHYRLILSSGRTGPRPHLEGPERTIVVGTIAVALVLFGSSLATS